MHACQCINAITGLLQFIPSIHLLSPLIRFSGSRGCWSLSRLTWREGGVTPWTNCRFISGPQSTTSSCTHTHSQSKAINEPHLELWRKVWKPRRHREKMAAPHLRPDSAVLTTTRWRRLVRDADRLTAVVNMAVTTFLKRYSCPCQCGAMRDEKELLRVSGACVRLCAATVCQHSVLSLPTDMWRLGVGSR